MKILISFLLLAASFSASALVGNVQYFSFDNPVYYPVFGEPSLCSSILPCQVSSLTNNCKAPIIGSSGLISGYNGVYRVSGYDFCFKVKNKPVVIAP